MAATAGTAGLFVREEGLEGMADSRSLSMVSAGGRSRMTSSRLVGAGGLKLRCAQALHRNGVIQRHAPAIDNNNFTGDVVRDICDERILP